MDVSQGDQAQIRMVAEQLVDAAMTKVTDPVPAPLKWAGAIIAAAMTAGSVAVAIWVVGSIGDMKETLARVDERLLAQTTALDARFQQMDERIDELETYHRGR